MTKRRWLLVLAAVCLSAGARLAGAEPPETQWHAVFLGDTKIGHVLDERSVIDGTVINVQTMALTVSRGEFAVTVSIRAQTEETADGKPLGFERETVMGPLGAARKAGVVTDGKVQVATLQMGRTSNQTVDYPEGALMPEGARLLMKSKGLKAGTKYSYKEFDTDGLRALEHRIVVEPAQSVTLIGQVARLTPIRDSVDFGGQAMEATVYVDDDLRARKFEIPMLGMKLVVVACDEAYAKSPNGKFDVLAAASPPSPAPIENPRQLRSAVYTLKPNDPKTKLQLAATDSQSVVTAKDGTVTVTVTVLTGGTQGRPYAGADPAAKEALAASEYVQSGDAAIVAQARAVVGDEPDAWKAAKTLEAWVARHVSGKDLSVGYASAVETLQSKQGDCTEHAVLLAALCRAAGIPCRIATGIAYAEDFAGQSHCFIGHAWNQAYIDGKWVDLDAALGVDAARITFAAGGDDPTAFIGMLKSLRAFKIVDVKVK